MSPHAVSPKSVSHHHHILDFLYNQLFMFEFNSIRQRNLVSFQKQLDHFFNVLSSHNKQCNEDDYNLVLQRYILLTVFIRNKHHGKGQKLQFYAMVFSLYTFNPSFAIQLIQSIWNNAIQNSIHIGSFRDFKHLCLYISEITHNRRHPFIEECCKTYIKLLCQHNDYFMAKWTPREHSKYQWLYNKLTFYYAKYTSKNITSYKRKQNKYKNAFRRFVSSLCVCKTETNLCLNVFQDKSCFLFLPFSNMLTYKHRIIQSPSWGFQFLSTKNKLVSCAFEPGKLFKHLYKLLDRNNILSYDTHYEHSYGCLLDHFNSIWKFNIDKCSKFMGKRDFILFLDVCSLNFNDDDNTLYDMVGMALFSMHFSTAHKRIMVSSNTSHWLNFSHCNTFVDCVIHLRQNIRNMCWFTSCELTSSISTVLQAFQQTSPSPYNIYTFDLVFIHGNKNVFTRRCIDCVKHFKQFFNRFVFWNFCKSHLFKDIDEINNFEKNYSFISGNNVNALFDICNSSCVLQQFLHKIRKRHYLNIG